MTTAFIIFNSTTGAVTTRGICQEEYLDFNVPDGDIALAVPADVTGLPELNVEPLRIIVSQFLPLAPMVDQMSSLRFMVEQAQRAQVFLALYDAKEPTP